MLGQLHRIEPGHRVSVHLNGVEYLGTVEEIERDEEGRRQVRMAWDRGYGFVPGLPPTLPTLAMEPHPTLDHAWFGWVEEGAN